MMSILDHNHKGVKGFVYPARQVSRLLGRL